MSEAPLRLESGAVIEAVSVAYRTWGTLAAGGDNAVLVCHALTGSADVEAWWPGLIGAGCALDPAQDYIVCSNVLGGCYGTTGPQSLDPANGRPYGPAFPRYTIRDIVALQARLLDTLGVRRLRLVVGGSLGGMQVLEWAAMYPERVEAIAPVAVGARHSAWAIGLSASQRMAIAADPLWRGGHYEPQQPPRAGVAAARAIAMLSYRHWHGFESRFGRRTEDDGAYAIESYLRHQGDKLVERFDANTYVGLTHAMDTHDLGRGRGGTAAALGRIGARAFVVGIDSDLLYPPYEQEELARHLPHAELFMLRSEHGHDAFLIHTEEVGTAIRRFRDSVGAERDWR